MLRLLLQLGSPITLSHFASHKTLFHAVEIAAVHQRKNLPGQRIDGAHYIVTGYINMHNLLQKPNFWVKWYKEITLLCMFNELYFIFSAAYCTNTVHPAQCKDGDVRLVEGATDLEGRVELCLGQRWGTISYGGWSNTAAQVVCNHLGYSSTGNYIYLQ